jgi:hypothetical protein
MAETREAGPELDAMVAEALFDCEVNRTERNWWGTFRDGRRVDIGPNNPFRHMGELPEFSADVAAAWTVVEWMVAKGWKVDVQNRYAPTWACHVTFCAPDYRKVFTHTNSAPLSICLAALEATGALPLDSNRWPAALPPEELTSE